MDYRGWKDTITVTLNISKKAVNSVTEKGEYVILKIINRPGDDCYEK